MFDVILVCAYLPLRRNHDGVIEEESQFDCVIEEENKFEGQHCEPEYEGHYRKMGQKDLYREKELPSCQINLAARGHCRCMRWSLSSGRW